MLKNGDIIGPWKINRTIIDDNENRGIYEVLPNFMSQKEINDKLKGISVWYMKVINIDIDYSENEIIKTNNLIEIPNIVIVPLEEKYLFGNFDKYEWYIMEKCNGDILNYIKTAYQNWEKVLETVCNFLKCLHYKRLVHGDLKLKNILYKSSDNTFKICDFESCVSPKFNKNCINRGRVGYYYYYIGAIPEEPCLSYKTDLQAFGTLLWAIFCNNELSQNNLFRWQELAVNCYEKKISYLDYVELNNSKEAQFMPEIIKEYFKIISKIDSKSYEPPDENIYKEILNLKKYKLSL